VILPPLPEAARSYPLPLPKAEVLARIHRFQRYLREDGIGAAVLVQNVDRFYFTGTMQAGFVVVPHAGEALLCVRRDPERAAAESPLPVRTLASVRELPAQVREALGEIPSPLGLETDVLPVTQAERIRALFPGVDVVSATRALMMTRAIKSPHEIAHIRQAARTVAEVVERVPEILVDGMPEVELAARIEWELRQRGHGGFTRMRGFNQEMFFGHVMAGRSAAAPTFLDAPTGGEGLGPALPQGAGSRPIRKGDPVVVDLVGNCQGYLCDQTRTFSLGPAPRLLIEAHRATLRIMHQVIEEARPGAPAGSLFETARAAAGATPFADQFLGDRHKVSFVGHGIGLEVDEYPFLASGFEIPLEAGMVFALEPKLIFPDWGVVGVEDTFLVTDAGVERLTLSPHSLGIVGGG
jgi:Xaa-Pro dipeptidase